MYLADDGCAVAGRPLRDRPLLDVPRQVEKVLLALLQRLLGQRRRVRIRELLRVGVVVAAVGGPLRRLVVLEDEREVRFSLKLRESLTIESRHLTLLLYCFYFNDLPQCDLNWLVMT